VNKQELRKFYLQKRLSLTSIEYEQLSNQLCQNFFAHVNLSGIKVLHTFLPIKKFKEPDTWIIIERLKGEFSDIKISIPKVTGQSNDLEHFYLEEEHILELSDWGIPEIHVGAATQVTDIEMVLVPLLAFDRSGHRVGYGKGFYDKFLTACSPACKKIGLSFFPAAEDIEINQHDQPLTAAVTPDAIFTF
jgi:5-formyltetrahydrofolate cyclo-ligase